MKKALRFAVLLCAVLILVSGCGKNNATADTVDNITLSNLKTSASSLTPEEKEYMDAITDVLKAAEFFDTSGSYHMLAARNTTAHDLNIYLYTIGLAENGDLTYTNTTRLHHWEKGQKLEYTESTSLSDNTKELMIIGEYRLNDTWYMTDPVPLTRSAKNNSQVALQYTDPLPTVVRVEQDSWNAKTASYSLLDFSLRKNTGTYSYTLTLKVRKEGGTDNASEKIPIRILDKDGRVHCTGDTYVYLKRGETALVTYTVNIYEPGEYYLELK